MSPTFGSGLRLGIVLLEAVLVDDEVELRADDGPQRPADALADVVAVALGHALRRACSCRCGRWRRSARRSSPCPAPSRRPCRAPSCRGWRRRRCRAWTRCRSRSADGPGPCGTCRSSRATRDSLASNEWREWQAWQEPFEPSGFSRPMPLLGQVSGSITGLPSVPARRISPLASRWNLTMLPWHCQQPLTASAMLPGHARDLLGQHVVEAGEDLARPGVVAARELLVLLVVALGAVLRRHQGRDPRPLVLPGVRPRPPSPRGSRRSRRPSCACARALPLHDERGRLLAVTVHARVAGCRLLLVRTHGRDGNHSKPESGDEPTPHPAFHIPPFPRPRPVRPRGTRRATPNRAACA